MRDSLAKLIFAINNIYFNFVGNGKAPSPRGSMDLNPGEPSALLVRGPARKCGGVPVHTDGGDGARAELEGAFCLGRPQLE